MGKPNNKKKEMKRKVITLETKVSILDRLHKNERVVDIARIYSMNEATIRTIRKNEDSIRRSVAAGVCTSMSTTSHVRNVSMETMEKALIIWLEDLNQKRIPVDTNIITTKALKIYETINNEFPSTSANKVNFTASHGWFERFKQRHALHNLKLKGEQASADSNAAELYPQKFAQIIAEKLYTPDQVFNADESALFWKRMPGRTFLAKRNKSASGHKAAKDRITILFCSNASGDHIMKPLVINKSKKPRSFKGVNVNNLPVYWNANKKAWVTATLFNDWFHNTFVPDAKKYLDKKGQPFKVLLLLDNAPGHPQDLQHENVEVVFLPKNTTSLLQPLDQGIISTFKALYIKRTFRYILDQLDNDTSLSIVDAWKKFTMLDCIKFIGVSYAELKKSTLHGCWKALWPNVVDAENSQILLENEYSQIIGLAHTLGGEGFEDLAEADIVELMVDSELTENELIEMVHTVNENESDVDEQEPNAFTAKVVREGLEIGKRLGNFFLQNDPNVERALRFQRNINNCLSQYEEAYKDLNKNKTQLLITDFTAKTQHINVNSSNKDTECNELVISSGESDFSPVSKRRRMVTADSDSNETI